jgi:hypothetical protein
MPLPGFTLAIFKIMAVLALVAIAGIVALLGSMPFITSASGSAGCIQLALSSGDGLPGPPQVAKVLQGVARRRELACKELVADPKNSVHLDTTAFGQRPQL